MSARTLNEAEIYELKSRHLWDFLIHGFSTRYITDEIFGVVLIFQKTDGTPMVIATDLTDDPSVADPSTVGYVTQEVLKPAGQTAGSILQGTTSLVTVAAIAVAAYYGYKIVSGK